jgi:uncharacterized membrane protein YkvA (DUF1232 family)
MAEKKSIGNYHAFLEEEINSYRGAIKDYIYYLPALFKALCGTLDEPALDAEDRKIILAALGYLVAPNDVVPEAVYGPAGYIDDVFACVCVLDRLVRKHGVAFVEPYWEKETDPLEEFLADTLEETKKDLGDLAEKVLAFTGLG